MIVAGQTENLESIFNASVLKRFEKALDVPWQDFYAGIGSSVPLVLRRKKNGSTSAGYLIMTNNRL